MNWLRRFVAVGVIVMIPHLVLPTDPGYADRTDLDHHESCLSVLGNTTRTKLNSHWERFRWD